VPPESPSTASRASPRWLSSPRPGASTSCTGGGGLQEGGRRQLLQERPATARVAAGGGELAFLFADCDGGCDGTAWVPVEGFSGCPATAELGASWGLDLLHGRRRASRWRRPAGRRGASRRQHTLSEARAHAAQRALPRRAWRGEEASSTFLCADCDHGCDGAAQVPVEGFSGCPVAAELAASWGLDLLHGRRPAGRPRASKRQRLSHVSHLGPLDMAMTEMAVCTTAPARLRVPQHLHPVITKLNPWRTTSSLTPHLSSPCCRDNVIHGLRYLPWTQDGGVGLCGRG
jgi:hypothetical protein